MVNFRDPIAMASESNKVNRFWSFVDGIFIWEFMTTLDYEWNVIRGRRPHRWTIWIYSLTRVATLATVTLNMYSIDVANRINCQVTVDLQFIFAYLAFAASSLLIVLRIIAIWDRKKIIVALATGVWGITIAFIIQGVIRFRSSWKVDNNGCVFNLDSIRLSTVVAFAADSILLLIMFFGLYRLRRRSHGGLMALGRLLWNQGVLWLLLVVTTELMPTVFILLNLNQVLDLMFHVPWTIAMSIAATRMYRSLSDFLSSDVVSSQKIPPTSGRIASESNGTATAPVLLTGIQVAVHTTHDSDQRSAPQANHFGSNINGQPHGKPHELIVGIIDYHDIKSREEKYVV